ncbi:MAG: gamma-glutamyltransferase, partial [Pseudomonadota bacterium]|nr:gamma-glutamyltransferase [Pseudomonadota bacterium]
MLSVFLVISLSACEQKSPRAAIASAHPLATQAGMEILAAGGNAFDAAVTVSAVLAVVEPYSSGLGGGGFWLLHRQVDGFQVMVDGRERAPLAASRDMYLDTAGEVVPGLSVNGALAAGIPGEPAALVHIAQHYGRLPLGDTLAPAIQLARDGFAVDPHYLRMVQFRLVLMQDDPETARIFLQDDEVPAAGHRIVQPELAATLEAMARHGMAGFYQGRVASLLVEGIRKAGGIWSQDDLAQYAVVERKPVTGSYRGMKIVAAALPSSGGIVLLEMLNILSAYPLDTFDDATRSHVVIEAMRRAYRDRARYLGDPDFGAMPVTRLISPGYAADLRESIQLDHITPGQ